MEGTLDAAQAGCERRFRMTSVPPDVEGVSHHISKQTTVCCRPFTALSQLALFLEPLPR